MSNAASVIYRCEPVSEPDPSAFAARLLTLIDEAGLHIDRDLERARDCITLARRMLSDRSTAASDAKEGQGIGLAPWQMRRVAAHVEANLQNAIRMEDLAAIARLSTSHFSRAFRDSFSQTPYAYVLSRRIARAKELMAETGEPLAQIAVSCGMSDQAHLSRLFHRLVGESPSRWRRRHVSHA